MLQDVFVRAYGALRNDNREMNVRAWLYRVAHNRCIDHLRRPVPPAAEIFEVSRKPLHDPVEEAQRRDDLRQLVHDVGNLPEQQRSALLMREIDGMTYADLADALDVTVPAVKSLLVRARVGLVEAAEARDADCARDPRRPAARLRPRREGVRPRPQAHAHLRRLPPSTAARCAAMRRSFAALAPIGFAPFAFAAKLIGSAARRRRRGAVPAAGGGCGRGRRRRRRDGLQGRRGRLHGRDRHRRRGRGQARDRPPRARPRPPRPTRPRRRPRPRQPPLAPPCSPKPAAARRSPTDRAAPPRPRPPPRQERKRASAAAHHKRRGRRRSRRPPTTKAPVLGDDTAAAADPQVRDRRRPRSGRGPRRDARPGGRPPAPLAPRRTTPPADAGPGRRRRHRADGARRPRHGGATRPRTRPAAPPPRPPAERRRARLAGIDYPEPLAHETLLVRRGRRSGPVHDGRRALDGARARPRRLPDVDLRRLARRGARRPAPVAAR